MLQASGITKLSLRTMALVELVGALLLTAPNQYKFCTIFISWLQANSNLGEDENSWSYDGSRQQKFHNHSSYNVLRIFVLPKLMNRETSMDNPGTREISLGACSILTNERLLSHETEVIWVTLSHKYLSSELTPRYRVHQPEGELPLFPGPFAISQLHFYCELRVPDCFVSPSN